jgi:transcriptional regulator with XRE-family HTH domain
MARKTNGYALRVIRELTGIKQEDLAAALGIGKSSLSGVESGHRNLAPDKLRKAADRLGVPIDAISTVLPEPEPDEAMAS